MRLTPQLQPRRRSNVTFPPNVGIAGDLFVIIYIAKENKLYQLNASGIAPSGLSLARMNSLG